MRAASGCDLATVRRVAENCRTSDAKADVLAGMLVGTSWGPGGCEDFGASGPELVAWALANPPLAGNAG